MLNQIFHCSYYFDGSVQDFVLHGIFTNKDDAENSLIGLSPEFISPCVVTRSTNAIRLYFLEEAKAAGGYVTPPDIFEKMAN